MVDSFKRMGLDFRFLGRKWVVEVYLVRGRVERGRVSYEALSAFGLNFWGDRRHRVRSTMAVLSGFLVFLPNLKSLLVLLCGRSVCGAKAAFMVDHNL